MSIDAAAKRLLINIGLLILVVILAALVWYEGIQDTQPVTPTLATVLPSLTHRIRIESPDREAAEFKHTDNEWRLVKPFNILADPIRIRPILMLYQQPINHVVTIRDQDIKQFSLNPPLLKLTLEDTEIAFGGSQPIDRRRYIRIADELYLIDNSIFIQLNTPAVGFIDRRLLPKDAQPERFIFNGLALFRNDQGEWQSLGNTVKKTRKQLLETVTAWLNERALWVRRLRPDAVPLQTITIHLAGSSQAIVYAVLAYTPELVLARLDLGVEYHLPGQMAEKLLLKKTIKKGEENKMPPGQQPETMSDTNPAD